MGLRIDRAVVAPIIVSGEIDLAGLNLKDPLPLDVNRISVFMREFFVVVPIKFAVQSSPEKMVLEFWDEILHTAMS